MSHLPYSIACLKSSNESLFYLAKGLSRPFPLTLQWKEKDLQKDGTNTELEEKNERVPEDGCHIVVALKNQNYKLLHISCHFFDSSAVEAQYALCASVLDFSGGL